MTKESMRKATMGLVIQCYREKYRIQRDIDEYQLELLEIKTEMSGLARHGTEMTPEQKASSLPMPGTASPAHDDQRLLSLIERKDELETLVDYLEYSKQMAKKVELLSFEDRSMLHDLHHSQQPSEDVAAKYGYTKQGMYKRIKAELTKVI